MITSMNGFNEAAVARVTAEADANVRLIADLLAACRAIECEFGEWAGPEEPETSPAASARNRSVRAYEAVRNAIARAEGR